MVYRVLKGEELTEGEVENNFIECIDLVTPTPTNAAGQITNFNIRNYYKSDGTIAMNRQTGAFTGTGKIWAIEYGKNISLPLSVV